MAFDEVRFPTNLSYGSRGGPGHRTAVIETDSGAEERISRWSSARRRYNAAYAIKDFSDLDALRDFVLARQGAARGFRFKDFLDFTTAADHRSAPAHDDEDIGVGDGTETQFQIATTYTSGLITRTRNVRKPVAGTVKVGLDGVDQASGWSVNDTTGIVTFTVAPGAGVVVNAGCEYDVPVRFGLEIDEVLGVDIQAFETGGLEDVPLIELIDEDVLAEEFLFRGAKDHGVITASISITEAEGVVQRVAPTTTGLVITLPAVAGLALGGPQFFIVNDGSVDVEIQSATGTSIVIVAAGGRTTLVLGLVGATRTWFAV